MFRAMAVAQAAVLCGQVGRSLTVAVLNGGCIGRCLAVGALIGMASAEAFGATIQVPGDQPTIQAGIDAAVNGDEVVVADGTYSEIIDFNGKAITVRSVNGAGVTTIDATGVADPGDGVPVVRCDNGETSTTVLEGFTLTGGTGDTSTNGDRLGGGMFNYLSSPTVTDCVFDGNSAHWGGGMINALGNPTITNCTFIGNTATSIGGGMDNHLASPMVTNCTFIGNSALGNGGGMWNANSSLTVTNCTFSGNSANRGGGVFNTNNDENSHETFTNCTFSGNTASNVGGGMSYATASNPTVTNAILWGNSDGGGMDESAQVHVFSGTPVVNYSDVQGGWTGTGGNNINADPLFVDADGADDVAGTADDNLRLSAGSPCIDAGDDSVVTESTDLHGNARIVNCVVDMGAYEEQTAVLGLVPADRDCDGDVDGVDFAKFAECFNRAGNPPRTLGCDVGNAEAFDFDDDIDIDGADFAKFAQCFNKAGNPPRTLGCPQN